MMGQVCRAAPVALRLRKQGDAFTRKLRFDDYDI